MNVTNVLLKAAGIVAILGLQSAPADAQGEECWPSSETECVYCSWTDSEGACAYMQCGTDGGNACVCCNTWGDPELNCAGNCP